MDHKMRRPIEGSQRTTLAIARVVDGEIEPLTREQKKSVHMTFDQIRAEALKTASATLAQMKPKFLRDKNGVIRHAAIESPDPLTASCVLAPEFGEKFRDTLGPDPSWFDDMNPPEDLDERDAHLRAFAVIRGLAPAVVIPGHTPPFLLP
jgi:hypothetical protein